MTALRRARTRAPAWLAFLISASLLSGLVSLPSGARAHTDVDPALLRAGRGLAGAVEVIVQKWNPFDRSAERRVERSGGVVTRDLPIVNGFSATVPASAIDDLAEAPSVRALTLDRPVRVFGSGGGSPKPKSVYPKVVRANQLWSAGVTGAGVTVALVDTGIADVPDLAGRVLPVTDDVTGEVEPCVNISGEPDCADSYGHGTFLAGIIAGNGASSNGTWKGVAPAANLVSIKIAGRDGAADVSGVLAAIQWVVSFKDRYGIRVLNLSLGTDGTQTYRTDPLNYAVERAWAAGIVVVVSASNRGPDAGTIAKPGDDPWVITVGAVDDNATAGVGDDLIPDFSSRGPTAADGIAKPDVVAPGAHVVSLRAPGSAIDTEFPYYVDGAYRRGSGTSMSAAVVSGAAALMAQADPAVTPNRVKFALSVTARRAASDDRMAVGAGVIDAYAAAFSASDGLANAGLDRSSGLGSLDASRGTVRVQADDPLATLIGGTLTAQLLLWDPILYTGAEWDGARWYASSWNGARWYGARWYASTWNGARWYGARWYGQPDGARWYGSEWMGARWYGAWE